MKKYSALLDQWEEAAEEAGNETWFQLLGEGLYVYAKACERQGTRPTFAGLMRHIDKIRPCPPEEVLPTQSYGACRDYIPREDDNHG